MYSHKIVTYKQLNRDELFPLSKADYMAQDLSSLKPHPLQVNPPKNARIANSHQNNTLNILWQ